MDKLIIVLIAVVVLAVAGVIIFVIVTAEPPTHTEYDTLRIKAKNKDNFLNTYYEISFNRSMVKKGTLSKTYWEEFNAEINKTYTITAWNNNFYSEDTRCTIKKDKADTKQCIVELTRPIPNITIQTEKIADKEYNIRIKADYIREPLLCLEWSFNVINVYLYREDSNMNTCDIPQAIQNKVDKCFKIDTVEEKVDYTLKYTTMPTQDDWINIYVLDLGDYSDGEHRQDYFYNQKDLGAVNKIEQIHI